MYDKQPTTPMKPMFSAKAYRAMTHLASGMTRTEVCIHTPCSMSALKKWLKDARYIQQLIALMGIELKSKLPELFTTMIEQSKGGSEKHMKLILDYLQHLDNISNKTNKGSITFTWDDGSTPVECADSTTTIEDNDKDGVLEDGAPEEEEDKD